ETNEHEFEAKEKKERGNAIWCSAMVAGLFALHPLHVESVAWIAERKDVLSGFFVMLTLLAYAKYVAGKESKVQSPKSKVAEREMAGKSEVQDSVGPSGSDSRVQGSR